MKIELANVGKRFDGVPALRDVSLTIESGKHVALVGPNGSGKTTLIRVVMGMLQHRGTVLLDGRDAYRQRAELAQRLAYAPQIAPQMSVSVGEMIRTATRLRGSPSTRVVELAGRLGLDVDAIARRAFRGLSGGMKQKLLLALAMAARATLLVLDEPTASLDTSARAQFFQLFDEVAGDATLILCSHRLEEIRQMVDHVCVLHEGRLVHEGTVGELVAGRGTSVIELLVDGTAHEHRWLVAHRFARGFGGWWLRHAQPSDKRELVAGAFDALGAGLRDFSVRDMESVDPRVS